MKPAWRWVGSKRQLLPHILPLVPEGRVLVEPFAGGGAVFWATRDRRPAPDAVLADANRAMMATYHAIQNYPAMLRDELNRIPDHDWGRNVGAFNALHREARCGVFSQFILEEAKCCRLAARFLYLVSQSFNGLWRENRSGDFNAARDPGRKGAHLKFAPKVQEYSEALQGVDLHAQDFGATLDLCDGAHVVYVDPPYMPPPAKPGPQMALLGGAGHEPTHTAYTGAGFGIRDQRALVKELRAVHRRGAVVVASNVDSPAVRSLYEGFELIEVQARRNVNRDAEGRGPVDELLMVLR